MNASVRASVGPVAVDFVQNRDVGYWPILLNKSGGNRVGSSAIAGALGGATLLALLGWLDVRHWYQFRELPEVLGGGCEEELIAGTIRSS